MMYKRRERHADLCVLRISPTVLDLPGVIITDRNAASGFASFRPSPTGLEHVDRAMVFAEWWTDPDAATNHLKRSVKCAEVLVPACVQPQYVEGAYVSCPAGRERLIAVGFVLPITLQAHFFFQD